jgi:hypothetical protein
MDNIKSLELQNEVELHTLRHAIQKRMDALKEECKGYKREDVIEYTTLYNIMTRINPQLDTEEVPFAKKNAWML